MKVDVLTIFPKMFEGTFGESILRRAQDKSLVEIKIHDLRDWARDKHSSVDARPYGGGPGMVMRVDVIDRAVNDLEIQNSKLTIRKILLSAKGGMFDQKKAREYLSFDQLILIAGHYEGVDERVAEHLVDEEVRIGDYVLTGGELPAMVVVDSVVRLLPGVLGNEESTKQESHSTPGYFEYPQYTRPEEYKGWKVPEVLLSGDHAKIERWNQKNSRKK